MRGAAPLGLAQMAEVQRFSVQFQKLWQQGLSLKRVLSFLQLLSALMMLHEGHRSPPLQQCLRRTGVSLLSR